MLENAKQTFFEVDNERKLFLGKTCFALSHHSSFPMCWSSSFLCFLAVAEKNEAVQRASTLEEKLKALKEENAALKLAADAEKSQKDRLLAVVHTLTGMLDIWSMCTFFLR